MAFNTTLDNNGFSNTPGNAPGNATGNWIGSGRAVARAKLERIIRHAEASKAEAQQENLIMSNFAVFLLFGASKEHEASLRAKARQIASSVQAYAFVDARGGPEGAVRDVWAAIEGAKSHVPVRDLVEIHVFPVAFSAHSKPDGFWGTVRAVSRSLAWRHKSACVMPFLLLDAAYENSRAAYDWLTAMDEGVRDKANQTLRCCVLSSSDERDFGVSMDRLLMTMLLTAFFSVVEATSPNVGRRASYGFAERGDTFFSAQSASIANPVATRTLRAMLRMLETVRREGSRDPSAIEMGFLRQALRDKAARLPRDGDGNVTLAPLRSVMPEPRHDLARRLGDFARAAYHTERFKAMGGASLQALLPAVHARFIDAFVREGGSADMFESGKLRGDKLAEAAEKAGIAVAPMPPLPGKYAAEQGLVYDECARQVAARLGAAGKTLVEAYIRSERYLNAPSRIQAADEAIDGFKRELESALDSRKGAEATPPLPDDPDEAWINAQWAKTGSHAVAREAYHALRVALILGEDSPAPPGGTPRGDGHAPPGGTPMGDGPAPPGGDAVAAFGRLADILYESAQEVPGMTDRQEYMRIANAACQDPRGKAAGDCVSWIREEYMRFPVRLRSGFRDENTDTIIWGDKNCALYEALNADGALSGGTIIDSAERFVVLRLSQPFSREEIESAPSESMGPIGLQPPNPGRHRLVEQGTAACILPQRGLRGLR